MKYVVTAHPYVVQYGTIDVPENVPANDYEKLADYIDEHWNEIEFSEPDLDYADTDFEIDKEEK